MILSQYRCQMVKWPIDLPMTFSKRNIHRVNYLHLNVCLILRLIPPFTKSFLTTLTLTPFSERPFTLMALLVLLDLTHTRGGVCARLSKQPPTIFAKHSLQLVAGSVHPMSTPMALGFCGLTSDSTRQIP